MRPINIYALTRPDDIYDQARLERQMSGRHHLLRIKEWEIAGLKTLCDELCKVMEHGSALKFYYSFTMPRLGKEFDLLRISSDITVNIELKSGNVSDEVIKRQLEQNRYYLSTLDRTIYSFTYLSNTGRLVRLSGGGRLIDTSWDELASILLKQEDCYEDHIEQLFSEDRYLISPLTDPLRFLRGDYFLTSQQRDIRNTILNDILIKPGVIKKQLRIHGFTGLPGTGKTILLYDIAMQLSVTSKVCILHFGSHEKELEHLNERLKRVDFYYCDNDSSIDVPEEYGAVLVDEGHRLNAVNLNDIMKAAGDLQIPVIISYDREDSIAYEERSYYGAGLIESLDGFNGYRLTNKIRLNSELSVFISRLVNTNASHRRDYPSVSVAHAADDTTANILINDHIRSGYIYIWDASLNSAILSDEQDDISKGRIEVTDATCREFDNVVMLIDDTFSYDENGYLRSVTSADTADSANAADATDTPAKPDTGSNSAAIRYTPVRNLFHGLSRAKEHIAIIVKGNKPVFEGILTILQGK
ncbi:MAG: ATP-binding protein [Lachnospiraceae bacterium]|nr:ATP-binding protein [Lachnospiraceae bacterium]